VTTGATSHKPQATAIRSGVLEMYRVYCELRVPGTSISNEVSEERDYSVPVLEATSSDTLRVVSESIWCSPEVSSPGVSRLFCELRKCLV
jgi:hypothetical protein